MIDAHLHLFKTDAYNSSKDFTSSDLFIKSIEKLDSDMKRNGFNKGLVYIIDESWNENQWLPLKLPENIIQAFIINPFWLDIDDKLDALQKNNIKIIKLLPYEQKIMRKDYSKVLYLAKKIQERKMIITICCAYGSNYLYDTNGVELAAYLLNNGIKSSIILAHGGMVKVLDAMSLMLEFPNLYMDTSFTLPFWWGSSIIMDYAYVFKKLSYERIFYGSDSPYVSMEESYKYYQIFCEEFTIENKDSKKILSDNFQKFLLYENLCK